MAAWGPSAIVGAAGSYKAAVESCRKVHLMKQRAFAITLTVIGILYVLLASSMLVPGPAIMLDFAVSAPLVAEPVFADFFMFFYQWMAGFGVLIAVLAWTVRERDAQAWVAVTLCAGSVLLALRDLSTSDSALGNRLYRGPGTLIPVFISVVLAVVLAVLAWRCWAGQSKD
jgi:hypothetical protein